MHLNKYSNKYFKQFIITDHYFMEIELLDPFITQNEIINYEQSNPFYLSIEGSKHLYTKIKFLADEYQCIYILCLADNFQKTKSNINKINLFLEPDSELSELYGQNDLVVLIRAPFSLMRNHTIKMGLITIEKNILEQFNNLDYQLQNKELVFLMLESKETDVENWLKLYRNQSNLDQFIRNKIFFGYHNLNDTITDNHLLRLISEIADFKYWEDENNCRLTINKTFDERKFNLKLKWNLPVNEIEKEFEKILEMFSKNKQKSINQNYPPQLTHPHKNNNQTKSLPINALSPGNLNDYTYFELCKLEELIIKYEDIEELLLSHCLSEKEKYYLIANLLISKNYCHYVLNQKKILEANESLFKKYKPIFRYLVGYAWLVLYKEESIKKNKILTTDRFVYDLETASKLPVFPFCQEYPYLNPYISCLISDSLMNSINNIHGVKQMLEFQNGIVDLTEFKKRLNIFITGQSGIDLFHGADWSHMAITGGCMAAIMPKFNPLMLLFKKVADPKISLLDSELKRFFDEYYSSSDIDIPCNHDNMIDFIEHVKHLKEIICKNLGPTIKESEIIITPIKTLTIYINETLLKKKCDNKKIPFDYDYIIKNKHNLDVKFYFYELYFKQKKRSNIINKKYLGEKINDDIYFEIINYVDINKITLIINDYNLENKNQTKDEIEMIFYIRETIEPKHNLIIEDILDNDVNKEFNEEIKKENDKIFIKFSEILKYKINSKHLKRTIEIFKIADHEFFSCIGRFHLPCVRSYYNGTTCYLLPSAIIAYQTLTNIDFKYFVGSKDPIKIINKYRQRGYGTILNKMEIQQTLSYILTMDDAKRAHNIKDKTEIKKIIGSLEINHDLFKPRKYTPDDFAVDPSIKLDYLNPKINYLKGKEDIIKYYKNHYPKYSSEFIEKRIISQDGHVEPIKKWMIDVAYDLLQ